MSMPDISRLIELVKTIKQAGIPILLIEHHQDVVAKLCDRVAVMDGGRMIALGTPLEVRSNPMVIEAYLGADDDKDIAGLPASDIARLGLCLCPEGRHVFAPLTVEDNALSAVERSSHTAEAECSVLQVLLYPSTPRWLIR